MPNDDLDAQLVHLFRAALAGDEKAYAEFLRRAAALARAIARRRTDKTGVDPEDVVQEVLLAVHLKRHTWRADAPVLPWLMAITRHKIVDAYRRRGRLVEIPVDDIFETVGAPEADQVSSRDLGRVLDSLAPVQRAVVSAISVEGCSIGEAAQKLTMKETAVRVALHRGLAAIARKFGSD